MQRRRKKKQEDTEPVRSYDCRWYSRCLYYAAQKDTLIMPCEGCIRYEQKTAQIPVSECSEREHRLIYFPEKAVIGYEFY